MQIINLVNMANNIRREILLDPTSFNAFFLDRCFLTGYVYGAMSTKTRKWYLQIFEDCVASMKKNYNIDFRVVRIKPKNSDEHWEHIQARAAKDESGLRTELHETERAHFDLINDGYDALETDGKIDFVFETEFTPNDPSAPRARDRSIKFPIGRFFETIEYDMLAERYKDSVLTYDPLYNEFDEIEAE